MNPILMTAVDWLSLLTHFLSLSLLAVGGAITTAPEMHRYLVDERQWLSEGQFTSSIALAQAAPGPNVLFVALMGWNIGMNASRLRLARIFKEKVVRAKVADLEVHLFFAGVGYKIQVFIEHTIAVPVRARPAVVGAHGGTELVNFQEAANQFVTGIKLQHAIGAGPVLNVAVDLVLLFLGTANAQ